MLSAAELEVLPSSSAQQKHMKRDRAAALEPAAASAAHAAATAGAGAAEPAVVAGQPARKKRYAPVRVSCGRQSV